MYSITLFIIILILCFSCDIIEKFEQLKLDSETQKFINSLKKKEENEKMRYNKLNSDKKKIYHTFEKSREDIHRDYLTNRLITIKKIKKDNYNINLKPGYVETHTLPYFSGNPFYDSGPGQDVSIGITSLNNGSVIHFKRKKNLNQFDYTQYKGTYPPLKSFSRPAKPKYNKLFF